MPKNSLIRDTGSTNPDIRYANYFWHKTPDWLEAAAAAYRLADGGPPTRYQFGDQYFRKWCGPLFDAEISFMVGDVEHWATMPYKNIYPMARTFAELLKIELVSQPEERWQGCYVYEFRPYAKRPIPNNDTTPLRVGDSVQIVAEWQDAGDARYMRRVIEAPPNSSQVRVQADVAFRSVEWIEAARLNRVQPIITSNEAKNS